MEVDYYLATETFLQQEFDWLKKRLIINKG